MDVKRPAAGVTRGAPCAHDGQHALPPSKFANASLSVADPAYWRSATRVNINLDRFVTNDNGRSRRQQIIS
jgi:hypothetical protein